MERTPPQSVLEVLRREVNFGCPVQGCGEPYLTWHHFDPPWHVKQHHNPEGMIALCQTHHNLAEGGRWTKKQLKEMKRNPFVKGDSISNRFDYLRKKVVCSFGNIAYDVKNVLTINGERVIGFERDESGYDRLNILIRGEDESVILEMKNNFWTVFADNLYDLRCSAQGRELEIKSKDKQTCLKIRFVDLSLEEFRGKFGVFIRSDYLDRLIAKMENPSSIPLWTIRGTLGWSGKHFVIRDNGIEILPYHITVNSSVLVGGETVFSL